MASKLKKAGKIQIKKLDLRKELRKYLKFWPWFAASIFLCLALGFVYLRYATPVYSAKASIIINETGNGAGGNVYAEMGAFTGMPNNDLSNELGILQSRNLMQEVVKSLDLHIQYFIEGQVREVEIYDDIPFKLQVMRFSEEDLKAVGGGTFEVKAEDSLFLLKDLKTLVVKKVEPGVTVNLGFADVVLSHKEGPIESSLANGIIVKFEEIAKVASRYRGRIVLTQENKGSNLLELELQDPVRKKARDILDQLILEYNRKAIEDKNLIAGNTANFINDRLSIINGELDSVETGKEVFKERNMLTDIQAQSQMYMQNANEYNKRRQEVGTQLELTNAMLEYIGSNSQSELLPTNLGIQGGVDGQIGEYNNLVLQRNRILRGSSEKNPVIIRLNSQISQIKGNIVQSLSRGRSNLHISMEDLNRQASSIGSQIYAVPGKERQFREIERQQGIKETLYLFLLQKREENSLALAVTEPKAKIVDRAFSSGGIVSPNSRNIYLGSFVLGLFIPFSVVYIRKVLDNKIRSREDIEAISNEVALVGMVPRVAAKSAIIGRNDRSVLAESFRILITNLQYLLVSNRGKSRGALLFVTSTVKGEGKTFTATNLAITLANTGKKVLLLGADLRNPKLQPFKAEGEGLFGISDYLINEDLDLKNLIGRSKLHTDIDILSSGPIPPNPYELLKQEKVESMFADLKSLYDYVIVDTAPSMLVADTFLITKFADVILYVVRSGFTEKELLEFPIVAMEEGKLENVSFVLNGMNSNNLGYGAKYGYGYGSDANKAWGRRKTKLVPNLNSNI